MRFAEAPGKDIGVVINTPAQVHFYRNIIKSLELRGIRSYVVARDYGETVPLLEELKIDHLIYSRPSTSKVNKIVSLPADILRAVNWFKRYDIGLVTGFGVIDVYTSTLLGVPNLIFNDSEPMINTKSYAMEFKLFMPFVDNIVTPAYFREDMGKKQLKIKSLKEMAYLHPSYYTPNEDILDLLSVSKNEPYTLLRFNAFDAVHDLGIGGFTDEDKRQLVHSLEEHSTVFISSEKGVPSDLSSNIIRIPKSRIHDALYYAHLLVTDTQTMATESAILGTPTVRCNSFVGNRDMGNFIELEKNYKLLFNYSNSKQAIAKAQELIRDQKNKEEWGLKRSRMLNDYVDITSLMVWLIEDYPLNLHRLVKNPDTQVNFKFDSSNSLS